MSGGADLVAGGREELGLGLERGRQRTVDLRQRGVGIAHAIAAAADREEAEQQQPGDQRARRGDRGQQGQARIVLLALDRDVALELALLEMRDLEVLVAEIEARGEQLRGGRRGQRLRLAVEPLERLEVIERAALVAAGFIDSGRGLMIFAEQHLARRQIDSGEGARDELFGAHDVVAFERDARGDAIDEGLPPRRLAMPGEAHRLVDHGLRRAEPARIAQRAREVGQDARLEHRATQPPRLDQRGAIGGRRLVIADAACENTSARLLCIVSVSVGSPVNTSAD